VGERVHQVHQVHLVHLLPEADPDITPDGAAPRAEWQGMLPIGETEIPCYVLDNGVRIISQRAAVKALPELRP